MAYDSPKPIGAAAVLVSPFLMETTVAFGFGVPVGVGVGVGVLVGVLPEVAVGVEPGVPVVMPVAVAGTGVSRVWEGVSVPSVAPFVLPAVGVVSAFSTE